MVEKTKEKIPKMAIYHLSTKPISRSSGRSAVASVAYRAGIEITDERLGKTYDYTKRSGVLWTGLATPHGFNIDRNELWNRAEKTEIRSNSRTAREIVINIPHELMQGDQSAGKMLAYEFATNLSQKYQIAVDVAVHAPDKQGDNRNYHAHLLLTTRQITQEQDGIFEFGKKSQLEMSNAQLKQAGLLSNQDELKEIRREWAELANEYLAEQGIDTRIDHRSHKDRGLETLPTVKMGWKATELERQGIKTEVGDKNRAIKAYNAQIELKNELKEQVKAEKMAKTEPKTLTTDQNTLKNAPKDAIEPQKNKNGSQVPPKPKNTLKTKNNCVLEDNQKSINQEILNLIRFCQNFEQKCKIGIAELAQQMRDTAIQDTVKKLAQIKKEYDEHKASKPILFGRDKWQDRLHRLTDSYNLEKSNYDYFKSSKADERFETEARIKYRTLHEQAYKDYEQALNKIDKYMSEQERNKQNEQNQVQEHNRNQNQDKGKGR